MSFYCSMDKKYVLQAFEMKLKGRFDLLARYYGDYLFDIPAQIMIRQLKDELGIDITEDAIYNLKRRRKTKQLPKNPAPLLQPVTDQPVTQIEQKLLAISDLDPGTQVENELKEFERKKKSSIDLGENF